MKRALTILFVATLVNWANAQFSTDTFTATTNEVNDGFNRTKPVTPFSLSQWTGRGSGGSANAVTNWGQLPRYDITGTELFSNISGNTNGGASSGFSLADVGNTNRVSIWTPNLFTIYGVNSDTGLGGVLNNPDSVNLFFNNSGLTTGSPRMQIKGNNGLIDLQNSSQTITYFHADTNGLQDSYGYLPASSAIVTNNDTRSLTFASDFNYFGSQFGTSATIGLWDGAEATNILISVTDNSITLSQAGFISVDLLGLGQVNGSVFNGSGNGLTNLSPAAIVADGTYLANGTLATNSGALTGAFLTETGNRRKYTLDASSLTNLTAANLTGTIPLATLPSVVVTNNMSAVTNQIVLAPTSGTNFLLNLGLTNNFVIYATNNVYFTQPTNLVGGLPFAVWIYQDATGSRTVNFNTNYFKFSGGVVPIATTNANASDLYSFQVMARGTNIAVVMSPNFK